MKRYRVRFTHDAEADLVRLYDFLLDQDVDVAESALDAIREALGLLRFSPFSCRKAAATGSAFIRELVIPFGKRGYVALYEIERRHVTVLAVRHQREDDYH
jgi:plasmid stabilization system protein ParE